MEENTRDLFYDQNHDFEGEETLSTHSDESEEDIYPYKNINIARDSLSAFQLYRKYKSNIIKLDPEFQRAGVWNPKQKSELIESIIIGIPLPILYIKENKEGNWILIDGRQRLSTIFDFMDNRFALSSLSILKDYNGFKFDEEKENEDPSSNHKDFLKANIRGKIEDVNLVLHIIKEPTPERLTYDLFDRVNRGGTRLNNQEMRNAIYQGSSTKFLNTLSRLDVFRSVTSNIPSHRMKDRYLILRTLSFYLWKKDISIDFDSNNKSKIEYRSDLEDFLAKSMKFMNKKRFDIIDLKNQSYSKHELDNLCSKDSFYDDLFRSFNKAVENAFRLFGDDCFRLPKDGKIRRPINMALFEVFMYFFMEIEDYFENNEKFIIKEYNDLKNNTRFKDTGNEDYNFVRSLTYTVDSNKSVQRRFDIIDESIELIKML
ncbi:GmrSD restriction endonuclease domain-containing protein [Chryseobacterium sp. A321]